MTLLPIPPIESANEPIHSPADLQQRWRALMQELGFGERLLRVTFVGPDRRLVKLIIEVEIGPRPPTTGLDPLMLAVRKQRDVLGDGHTVAVLLTRPGRGGLSNNDRRWCAEVVRAADRFDIPLEPMFRANDEALLPVTARASAA